MSQGIFPSWVPRCNIGGTMTGQANLTKLLQSKNPNVHVLTLAAAFLFFFPSLTNVLDDPSLSAWKRVEIVSISIGELLAFVGVASASPENFLDEDD